MNTGTQKEFYKKIVTLTIPITLQCLLTMGVNLADNIMVGSLGEISLSAVALANQFISIYQVSSMGIGQGASVLAARFWGMRDEKALKQTITIMIRICLAVGMLFTLATLLFPEAIMRLFITEDAVIAEGIRYLKISAFTYLLTGLSLTCANVYRSIGDARWPLMSSIGAFFLNIGCNYIFIYGKLGMPRMGVSGAALGTLIARVFEFFFIFVYLVTGEKKIGYRLRNLFDNCRNLTKEFLRISLPVVISDTLYGIGNSAVSMVMGRIGSQFVSANSITVVTQQVSSVFVQGVSQSSSVIIGHTLGEGDTERAKREGWTFLKIGVVLGVVTGGIIILISNPIISVYNISSDTAAIARQLMYSIGIIMLFRSSNSILAKGVLRGGGDTKFLMMADVLFLWIASIPLGYLTGVVLKWPAFWVYCCLKMDEILKCICCVLRLHSGKWIKKISSSKEMAGEMDKSSDRKKEYA